MRARLLLIAFLLFSGISQAKTGVPEDSFHIRGFHLDLRIQVMKMQALKNFTLSLSKQGINTLVMEWEATYPFQEDPLIPNRFAYTRAGNKRLYKVLPDPAYRCDPSSTKLRSC